MANTLDLTRRQFGLLSSAFVLASAVPAWAASDKKTFVLASNTEVDNLDPHTASGNIPTAFFINVYDSLVRVQGTPPKIVPSLAASWDMAADGMSYTFKLQPAAIFQDGSPLKADAVKYSFDRLLRIHKGPAWMFDGILDADSVAVVDPETVKITLRKPFAAFLQVLPWVFVVNPKIVEANKGADDGQAYLLKNVAGSGPFKLTRVEPASLYAFERFDGYFAKEGAGNVKNIVWRIVRETSSQRMLLERGEVHYVLDLTAQDMDALKGKRGVVEVIEPTYEPFYVRMNSAHGPLADVNLRKAISYAFDYQGMLDIIGYADLMVGPLPTGMFGQDPKLDVYRLNMDKAKEYLAKSKAAAGGIKLTFVHVAGYEQHRRLGLLLLDNLKKLGIELEIRPLNWPDVVAACKTPETAPDFMSLYESSNYADPDNILFASYHSSQNGGWSNAVYKNPKVDELILAGRGETDVEKRKAIYDEIQKIIVDDAADIFGVVEKRKIGLRDVVKGYVFTPIGTNAPEFFPLSV